MSVHTATPWTYRKARQHFIIESAAVGVAEVRYVGRPDGTTSEQDAEFIVRACNSYDQLVAENARLLAALDKSTRALIEATGETA